MNVLSLRENKVLKVPSICRNSRSDPHFHRGEGFEHKQSDTQLDRPAGESKAFWIKLEYLEQKD